MTDGTNRPSSETPAAAAAGELLVMRNGAASVLKLNRPRALNALSIGMKATIAQTIPEVARNPDIYAVLLTAADGAAFCAGGDIIELAGLAKRQPGLAQQALADEYALIWLLECFSKPVVSLVNGPVMGSGAGITLVNTHRVAGESYEFAMPETAIGFFPDAGVAHTFSRLPDNVGLYLGLTGRRLQRADAFHLGLVTHCIPSARFDVITAALAAAEPIDPTLDPMHEDLGPGPLQPLRPHIAHCFGADTIGQIVARLERMPAEHQDWSAGVLDDLARASPAALRVALRHIREAAALDRRQVLIRDYRLGSRLILTADFHEGVRAHLVDKDHAPRWSSQHWGDVSEASLERYFASQTDRELVLPTRQEMQAARI